MRERLKELLLGKSIDTAEDAEYVANHLIENGVILPPCKVGDTIYKLQADGRIVKGTVLSIHQNLVGNKQGRWIVTSWFDNYYADSQKTAFECGTHLYSPFEDFGKTVFLTREEALKEKDYER